MVDELTCGESHSGNHVVLCIEIHTRVGDIEPFNSVVVYNYVPDIGGSMDHRTFLSCGIPQAIMVKVDMQLVLISLKQRREKGLVKTLWIQRRY